MKKRIRSLSATAVAIAMLLVPASAGAAKITIGSPFTAAFMPSSCDEACTTAVVESGTPGAIVRSPVNGAIVAWRLREGAPPYKYALRVLTKTGEVLAPEPEYEFLASGTSAPVTPLGGGVETFPTSLPIQTGQYIGINLEGEAPIGFNPGTGVYGFYEPPLADGHSGVGLSLPGEVAFNAEILPAPTISSLSATSGPSVGGTGVSIEGSDFAEVKSVSFGSTSVPFSVSSESKISTTSPAAGAGTVPVTVTTVAGTATAPQMFTYTAPPTQPTPIAAPAATCKVPKLQGRRLKGAKKGLRSADCKVGKVRRRKGVSAKTGKVVKQTPKAGTVLPAGAAVAVKLG